MLVMNITRSLIRGKTLSSKQFLNHSVNLLGKINISMR